MTNEQLVIRIQEGESELMQTLWVQVERFVIQQASKFYSNYSARCLSMSVDADDLKQEAYLAIHKAVEDFKADKDVKFLTYENYHLVKCFYACVGLHRASKKYIEVGYEYATNDNGEEASILNIIPDMTAEADLNNVLDRVYITTVSPILQNALDSLSETQRETAISCFGHGLSYSEFARQRGTNRATAQQAGHRALKNLRNCEELMAYAS